MTDTDAAPPDGTPSRLARVIVVDDQPDVLGLVALLLRRSGHTVHDASDGHEALDLLDEHDVDVVLTDLAMPGMNGPQLAERVRERRPHVAIVAMSGDATSGGFTRLPEGTALLTKPFTAHQLDAAIRNAIA